MNQKGSTEVILVVTGILALIIIGVVLMFLLPMYNIWASQQHGKALLMKAEQTRQILVTQASAERDAAKLRAEAIAIVGEAAKKYPEYRQQEFIGAFGEALKEGSIDQIIYVPTEAGIPILEANRHSMGK